MGPNKKKGKGRLAPSKPASSEGQSRTTGAGGAGQHANAQVDPGLITRLLMVQHQPQIRPSVKQAFEKLCSFMNETCVASSSSPAVSLPQAQEALGKLGDGLLTLETERLASQKPTQYWSESAQFDTERIDMEREIRGARKIIVPQPYTPAAGLSEADQALQREMWFTRKPPVPMMVEDALAKVEDAIPAHESHTASPGQPILGHEPLTGRLFILHRMPAKSVDAVEEAVNPPVVLLHTSPSTAGNTVAEGNVEDALNPGIAGITSLGGASSPETEFAAATGSGTLQTEPRTLEPVYVSSPKKILTVKNTVAVVTANELVAYTSSRLTGHRIDLLEAIGVKAVGRALLGGVKKGFKKIFHRTPKTGAAQEVTPASVNGVMEVSDGGLELGGEKETVVEATSLEAEPGATLVEQSPAFPALSTVDRWLIAAYQATGKTGSTLAAEEEATHSDAGGFTVSKAVDPSDLAPPARFTSVNAQVLVTAPPPMVPPAAPPL